jgi:hypothetical protein
MSPLNFAGYVPLRRGIWEHRSNWRVTGSEFDVLLALISHADKSTGTGWINAPTLHVNYCPDLSFFTVRRALKGLSDKGYIWRQIIFHSRVPYLYAVNKYEVTYGPHKGFQTSIAEVTHSNNPKDILYVRRASDPAPEGAPEGAPDPAPEGAPDPAPEGAPYYKKGDHEKGEWKSEKALVDSSEAEKRCPKVMPESEASKRSHQVMATIKTGGEAENRCQKMKPENDATPETPSYKKLETPVSRESLPFGLTRRGEKFFTSQGTELPPERAKELLEGWQPLNEQMNAGTL